MSKSLETSLHDAIGSHFGWQLHMKTSLKNGKSSTSAAEAGRCDCCEFGKWLIDPQVQHDLADTVQYRVIDRLHREFHHCAGQIIAQIEAGDLEAAQQAVDTEFQLRSKHLIAGLTKWIREIRASAYA